MAEIGLIGLGTMGAALALNIADKGFEIAVFNRTTQTTREFHDGAGALAQRITPTEDIDSFIAAIDAPRTVILMVPAGTVVDDYIALLREKMGPDDLILDAGNANFNDTQRRAKAAEAAGLPYLGVGVSGGEEGARHGPSVMAGGPAAAWERVAHILNAIAADYDGAPCAAYLGTDGAGHFVKTVHNGIEYADMQMIAETYGVMRDGLGMSAREISEVFATWNTGQLQSYLIEISAQVAAATDPATGQPVLDIILDRAGQKGTGRWTAIEAQLLGAPVSAIESAVATRNLSATRELRGEGERLFGHPAKPLTEDRAKVIAALENALLAGKIACYAQGFALLDTASETYGWSLPMPQIARIWRAGCIIRSGMLDDMASALTTSPRGNLIFASGFAERMTAAETDTRNIVALGALHGLPMPALSAGLSYFDTLRTGRGTANMLQAQRDYFGAHSFERVDMQGAHHGPWGEGR